MVKDKDKKEKYKNKDTVLNIKKVKKNEIKKILKKYVFIQEYIDSETGEENPNFIYD